MVSPRDDINGCLYRSIPTTSDTNNRISYKYQDTAMEVLQRLPVRSQVAVTEFELRERASFLLLLRGVSMSPNDLAQTLFDVILPIASAIVAELRFASRVV